MKRILAVILFIFMLSGGAMAGSKAVPSNWQEATPEGMAEAGLDLLLKGDYAAMVDKFFETADRKLFGEEKVLLLKRQIVAQLPTYEKYLRYEFIRREAYGKSLVKLKYLVVGESCAFPQNSDHRLRWNQRP